MYILTFLVEVVPVIGFALKLEQTFLMVIKSFLVLFELLLETAKETLCLCGLLLEGADSAVEVDRLHLLELTGARNAHSREALWTSGAISTIVSNGTLITRVTFVTLISFVYALHGITGDWCGCLTDDGLSALDHLDFLARLPVEQLVDEGSVLALLSRQVFNRHFKLIEGVLETEQVVQIKRELLDSLHVA